MLTKQEKVVKLLILNGQFERAARSLKSVAGEFSSVFTKKVKTKILEHCKQTIEELTELYHAAIVKSWSEAFEEKVIDELIVFFSSEAGREMVQFDLGQRDKTIELFKGITQQLFKKINEAIANLEESGEISLNIDDFDDEEGYAKNKSPFAFDHDEDDEDEDDEDSEGDGLDNLIDKY